MYIEELKSIYDRVCVEFDGMSSRESSIECELNDIYHFIELGTYSASDGSKLLKALKTTLSERRKIKDNKASVQSLHDKLAFVKKLKDDREKTYSFRTNVVENTLGKKQKI
jgi:hypothetical protein